MSIAEVEVVIKSRGQGLKEIDEMPAAPFRKAGKLG